jgi:hypothetical protein
LVNFGDDRFQRPFGIAFHHAVHQLVIDDAL